MPHCAPPFWLALAATILCTPASAQQPGAAAASAASAPAPYRSAFEAYQAFADQKIAPWRDSNDTVGKIGGWRAYAREASASGAPAAAPGAATAKPTTPAASDSHKH